MKTTVELATRDGMCRTGIFTPETGSGPWPGVIFCIDGGGRREALDAMAARISALGYVVALPDLFHRGGSVLDLLPEGVPREAKTLFGLLGQSEFREKWRARFYGPALELSSLKTDIAAVIAHFDSMASVAKKPFGVTGYCMGGNASLRIAGLFGDRIGAAASFHGGMLAVDQPDSPHLAAGQMKASLYVACAIEDPSCTEAMKVKLDEALTAAKVEHSIETYQARHGFAVSDSPSFNAEAAERHNQALAAFFARRLG